MTKEEKIAELINIRDNFNYALTPREVFDDAIKALEQEPKTGHWIRYAGGSLIDDYRCDCCNNRPPKKQIFERGTWGWDFTNFCPSCGAKMESEDVAENEGEQRDNM